MTIRVVSMVITLVVILATVALNLKVVEEVTVISNLAYDLIMFSQALVLELIFLLAKFVVREVM